MSSSNHMYNKNSLKQALYNHTNTNLLAFVSRHIRWLKTFPEQLTPVDKQKAVDGLVYYTYVFSDPIPDGDEHPLYKCWKSSPTKLKTILTETPPIACMGVAATKNTVFMHFPSLIKC